MGDVRRPQRLIDSSIPEGTLNRARDLTPLLQRCSSLVAPSTLELEGRVDQIPADLRVVHLCRGRLHPDVGVSAIRCRGAEVGERLHREVSAAQLRELVASRLVLADLASPLVPSLAPARQVCGQLLDRTRVDGRNAQSPVVECRQGEPKTLPLTEDDVLCRNLHVRKPNQAVLDGAKPMKRQRCMTSMPGVSRSTMKAVICLTSLPRFMMGGVAAMTTYRSAITPLHQSFSPLMIECFPSSGDRRRLHLGQVGPYRGLGQAEHTLRKASRNLLLLLGTEQLQGLRNTDGLVRAQRRDSGACGARPP